MSQNKEWVDAISGALAGKDYMPDGWKLVRYTASKSLDGTFHIGYVRMRRFANHMTGNVYPMPLGNGPTFEAALEAATKKAERAHEAKRRKAQS